MGRWQAARRGAVNVPATSTSTTKRVVVTLPVCPYLLQAAVFLTVPSGSAAACAAAQRRVAMPQTALQSETQSGRSRQATALVTRVRVCTGTRPDRCDGGID